MTTEGATHDTPASDTLGAIAPQTERKPGRLQTKIRNGVVITATSLILLEVILRLMGIANPLIYEVHPNVGFRIKPNQYVSYFRNPITINSYGVRDPRPLTTRDPNKKRVLCLGDSVTWGGIYERQENLFTSVAEHRLGNVEIVNAGVNGYSVHQMIELYENFLTELNPDLILVCALIRDFDRPPVTKLTGSGVAFPTQEPRFAIVEALRICQLTAYERWNWNWLEPPQASEANWFENETYEDANLKSVIELAKKIEGKQKLAVVFLPIEAGERTRIRAGYSRTLRNSSVKVARFTSDVGLTADDYVDGVHLSTSGHDKVGNALAALIDDELNDRD
ncbi:MAG: SGNH/GDSL hydrolase family protein [Candidatus Hydrogenedentes bacterium]|nr:SGNH/GDSL hydrolase family protein [Candidatus Hydrogenedentota bacterium]